MRPLMMVILACTSLVFGGSPYVDAQQHKTNGQQHQNNNAYAPMHFPNQNITFPNQNITFPNQNITFPNQNITFPNQNITFPNNAINFPTYAGNSNNGFNYSYGNGYYGNSSNSSRSKGTRAPNASLPQMPNATPMMAFGVGFSAASAVVPHHYRVSSHHYGVPNRSAAYRANGTNQANTLTPAQRHYTRLVNDIDMLSPQFQVLDTHRNKLKADIQLLVEGSNQPTASTVQQLSHNLANAMTRRTNPVLNTSILADDIRYVMNSGQLPKADVDQAISQTQNVLKEGGFTRDDIQLVVADMHAVAGEIRAKQTAQANATK